MTTHDRIGYRAMLLMMSLVILLVPMMMTFVCGLRGDGWWRLIVVSALILVLLYWQLYAIFKLQDQRAVENTFLRINRQAVPERGKFVWR